MLFFCTIISQKKESPVIEAYGWLLFGTFISPICGWNPSLFNISSPAGFKHFMGVLLFEETVA